MFLGWKKAGEDMEQFWDVPKWCTRWNEDKGRGEVIEARSPKVKEIEVETVVRIFRVHIRIRMEENYN